MKVRVETETEREIVVADILNLRLHVQRSIFQAVCHFYDEREWKLVQYLVWKVIRVQTRPDPCALFVRSSHVGNAPSFISDEPVARRLNPILLAAKV
jgi:hypothetical protein